MGTHATQIVFNLFLNTACSFFAGFLVVATSIKLFKIEQGRIRLFLLSLPFLKIFWDLFVRKIPSSSIAYTGINPLELPPFHQTLWIGGGFSQYGPEINLSYSSTAVDGTVYST